MEIVYSVSPETCITAPCLGHGIVYADIVVRQMSVSIPENSGIMISRVVCLFRADRDERSPREACVIRGFIEIRNSEVRGYEIRVA